MVDEGENLTLGDVGVSVHVHPDGDAYVVDFLADDGEIDPIVTVLYPQARAVMSHTRLTETSA